MAVGLRQRKKEQTRDALVNQALRLFARRGFDRVTVDEIAAACDVSPRTFFRYFGSKEDVLFADSDGTLVHLLSAIAAQPPNKAPYATVRAALLAVARDHQPDRVRYVLRRRLLRKTPSLHGRVVERTHAWERRILDQLRASDRPDYVGDLEVRLAVASAVTALRIATEVWAEDGDSDLPSLLESALGILERGLGD